MRFAADYKEIIPTVINTKDVLGHRYTLTSEYLLKDGEPYIFTMGEMHFSRVKESDWETELMKMKEGGIEIVASYLFWNHHESEKGIFDFSGNRNLRKFIDLCEKLEMPFFLRIGPWAHGEARLGGFPDWLNEECSDTRSNDEKYLFYVRRYFREIYEQVATSRNIIGIQIENEYHEGTGHLQYLYDMVKEIGFDALIFSATGWDNAVLPDCLQPMFGAYPEHPWVQNKEVFNEGRTYGFYSHDADRYWKRIGKKRTYPVLTCELGAGNQSTYRRRPLIMPGEVASLTLIQLGTGCKGLGYYMYHGGCNPVVTESDKIISSFQESKESGYPTDCPVVSYDFQSPLGDCGQYRRSYYELKTLFDFVKAEEKTLAKMQTFADKDMPDENDYRPLRAGVQSDGKSGFLFFINCLHGHRMPCKSDTAEIELKSGKIIIPLYVPENGFGIVPFNYRVGNETLKWVKAIPVRKADSEITFSLIEGIEPEYMTQKGETGNLKDVQSIGGMKITLTETVYPVRSVSTELKVCEAKNRLSFDIFSHIIPVREEYCQLPDRTKEYTVDIPEGTPYVSVMAEGNTAAAFEQISDDDFRLISDHFSDGDEWIIDVRGVKKLRLKIQPFLEEDKDVVYLEKNFVTGHFTPEVYALGEKVTVRVPESANAIVC